MFSLNRATIIGHLTRDPEVRTTPNGQSVANFGIATNRRWTDASGEQQEAAEFHEVVAWRKLAEICDQIFHKGDRAYVEGRLQTRSWEAQDGSKRSKTEIIADNLINLSPKKPGQKTTVSEEDVNQDQPEKTKKESKSKEKVGTKQAKEEVNIDDIPF